MPATKQHLSRPLSSFTNRFCRYYIRSRASTTRPAGKSSAFQSAHSRSCSPIHPSSPCQQRRPFSSRPFDFDQRSNRNSAHVPVVSHHVHLFPRGAVLDGCPASARRAGSASASCVHLVSVFIGHRFSTGLTWDGRRMLFNSSLCTSANAVCASSNRSGLGPFSVSPDGLYAGARMREERSEKEKTAASGSFPASGYGRPGRAVCCACFACVCVCLFYSAWLACPVRGRASVFFLWYLLASCTQHKPQVLNISFWLAAVTVMASCVRSLCVLGCDVFVSRRLRVSDY